MKTRARKLSFRKLKTVPRLKTEALRFQAMRMVEKGERPSVVARKIGIRHTHLNQWQRIYREKGLLGLKAKVYPFLRLKLGDRHRKALSRILQREDFRKGFRSSTWQTRKLQELLVQETKNYFPGTVLFRYLKEIGYIPATPKASS